MRESHVGIRIFKVFALSTVGIVRQEYLCIPFYEKVHPFAAVLGAEDVIARCGVDRLHVPQYIRCVVWAEVLENGNLAHDVLQCIGVRDEHGLCWMSLIINRVTAELML